ncbi:MAG: hypothetical protein V3T30_02700, partial [Thermodesulfobacteriota bacterium]
MNLKKAILIFPLFLFLMLLCLTPLPAEAGRWESKGLLLDVSPIDELLEAVKDCADEEIPKITLLSKPAALEAWPGKYVQLRWSVFNYNGSSWTHPIYLRKGASAMPGHPTGESVASIWSKNIKADNLPEGVITYYLVTRCGVAFASVGKVPKPVIGDAPTYILGGLEIVIKGRHFGNPDPGTLREVRVTEPGHTRKLEVETWTDNEIIATVDEDVLPGLRHLFISTGLGDNHKRVSNKVPLTVVRRDSFPAINLTYLIQELFSKTKIHINNFKHRRNQSSFLVGDAYLMFDESIGGGRSKIILPEYS